tara:strand:- start:2671 stop:2874 length:204 start_codon:yes stop_codon:yes gene_type:complete
MSNPDDIKRIKQVAREATLREVLDDIVVALENSENSGDFQNLIIGYIGIISASLSEGGERWTQQMNG